MSQTVDLAYRSGHSTRTFIIIAIAAGSGAVIGIVTAYFYCKRQKPKNDADMTRLNQELESIRRELTKLKEAVERLVPEICENDEHHLQASASKVHRKKTKKDLKALSKSTLSAMSQASLDAFFDAPSSIESSSVKSDDENHHVMTTNGDLESCDVGTLPKLISLIDQLQAKQSDEARLQAYTLMHNNYAIGHENSDFLWRFAMSCYLYGQTFLNKNQTKRKTLCEEARKFAFEALALKDDDADVHKWCALTLGIMSDFVGMKQKIEDGHHFKTHIDRALFLKPHDAVLHHLKGRWCFGVAGLTWFERKVATTLFAKPPDSTYDDALRCFIEADKLKPKWLENMLYIVKVYQAKGNLTDLRNLVMKSRQIKAVSSDDSASKREMEEILSRI